MKPAWMRLNAIIDKQGGAGADAAPEFRRAVESLLSLKQLAALKEIEFRRKLVDAGFTPLLVKRLGLSDQQVSAIKVTDRELRLAIWKLRCGFNDKLFGCLTAAQQRRIRDECERGKLLPTVGSGQIQLQGNGHR
jgi:hypothetical protein